MDMIENLIIAIVKPLISQPDSLTIKIVDTPEFLEYHLDLDRSDIGRIIGRKGRTISAIRTIVYSVPTSDKKVRLVIDERIESLIWWLLTLTKGPSPFLTYRKEEMMNLIWTYLKKYPKWIALDLLGAFLFVVVNLGLPTFLARMIDQGITKNDVSQLYFWAGMMGLIVLLGIVGRVTLAYAAES